MISVDAKRRTEADRIDPREALAAYLVEQFTRAKWTASYAKPATYHDLTTQPLTKE